MKCLIKLLIVSRLKSYYMMVCNKGSSDTISTHMFINSPVKIRFFNFLHKFKLIEWCDAIPIQLHDIAMDTEWICALPSQGQSYHILLQYKLGLWPWNPHTDSLNTSVVCYNASMMTRKQGDMGSSPAQCIIPIFFGWVCTKEKSQQSLCLPIICFTIIIIKIIIQ